MAQIKYVDNGTSAHIIKHDVSNNLYIIRIVEKELDYKHYVY